MLLAEPLNDYAFVPAKDVHRELLFLFLSSLICDICVGASVPLKSSPSFVRYFSGSCPQDLWPETMRPLKTTFSSDRLILDGDQPSMFSRRQAPIQSLFRSTSLEVQVDV